MDLFNMMEIIMLLGIVSANLIDYKKIKMIAFTRNFSNLVLKKRRKNQEKTSYSSIDLFINISYFF